MRGSRLNGAEGMNNGREKWIAAGRIETFLTGNIIERGPLEWK